MIFLSLLKNLKRAALFCILLCLFFSGFSKARIERGVEIRQVKPGFIETIPRNSITLVFQVKNTTQKSLSFKGDTQIPDGWQILTQELPFSLSSGQQAVRLVNIFVPTKTQTGHYQVSYGVKSKEDPSITACHSVEVHILLHAEIQLLKMDEPKIVIAGQDYVTQYIVSNKSNASSTIRLDLQNWPDYSFSISENQFFLKSGESKHVIVRVKTNGKIRHKAKYHHRMIAHASDLLEGSVTADVVSHVEIIPTSVWRKGLLSQIPS